MKERDYILIHHSPSIKQALIYYKGKEHTYEEYSKLIRRKELTKEAIKDIVLMSIFGAAVAIRGYVFLEYGI